MALDGINTKAELEAFIREAIDRSDLASVAKQVQSGVLSGTGSPAGVVAAPVGALYRRLDGGAGTTLYVKESGIGTSGWVAK